MRRGRSSAQTSGKQQSGFCTCDRRERKRADAICIARQCRVCRAPVARADDPSGGPSAVPGGSGKRIIRRRTSGAGYRFPPPPRRTQRQRLPARDDARTPLAWTLSTMPGKRRRSSTAADSSPRCSKAVRIAAASASDTTNIPGAWEGGLGLSKGYLGYPWAARCQQVSADKARSGVSPGHRNRSGDLSNAWPCSTELSAAFEPGLTHTPRHPDGCWALTGAALYDLAAGRFQGCTPLAVLPVHTKSVKLLLQFEHRNRSRVSGTSPMPASISFCMSAWA